MDRINKQVIYRFQAPGNFVNYDVTVTLGCQDSMSFIMFFVTRFLLLEKEIWCFRYMDRDVFATLLLHDCFWFFSVDSDDNNMAQLYHSKSLAVIPLYCCRLNFEILLHVLVFKNLWFNNSSTLYALYHILRPSSNRPHHIFTLGQKVKK